MNALTEKDCNPRLLDQKVIAVIGYGSQGHAHAQNLSDSGCNVVVGLRAGSASRGAATDAGLHVCTIEDATRRADLIMMLLPDEAQPQVYTEAIAPNLRIGQYLAFAHGFCIRFGRIVAPADVNVFMVAPKGPGRLIRRDYQAHVGIPALLAVHQDPAGDTRQIGLAYAHALSGGRTVVLETTFDTETDTDLFGEQAVLCGGLPELIRAAYETLTDAGYPPEMAYFECLHECKLIVDLLYSRGIAGMRESISRTAAFGGLTRGPRVIGPEVRAAMKQVLSEIQSGQFADQWMADYAAQRTSLDTAASAEAKHPLEPVGQHLRSLMPWLSEVR